MRLALKHIVFCVGVLLWTIPALGQDCENPVTTEAVVTFSYSIPGIINKNAVFTVAEGKQVYFSKGNLQLRCDTRRWRFARHQYDYIGSANTKVGSTYSGWIDLFYWASSGIDHTNEPWSNAVPSSCYVAGDPNKNMTGDNSNYDWGVYNTIYDDAVATPTGSWRTLTYAEWLYLLTTRAGATTSAGAATVNGVVGVILLPDRSYWQQPEDCLRFDALANAEHNSYTKEQWKKMEDNGAIFLPAAGNRNNSTMSEVGSKGYYWSATHDLDGRAYGVVTEPLSTIQSTRRIAYSVRLVKDK